ALHSLISAADAQGSSDFNQAAIIYRNDYLAAMRAEGRDAEREAGRLSLDEVRRYLALSVFPRLLSDGVIELPPTNLAAPDAKIRIAGWYWREVQPARHEVAAILRETGEHLTVTREAAPDGVAPARPPKAATGSVLKAEGLVKIYKRRRVVNDVALRLQQGE